MTEVIDQKPKTKSKNKVKRPKNWAVLIHNDDYTPMDFVVWILISIFKRSEEHASRITFAVHEKGQGIAGIFRHEIAETKAHDTILAAKQNNFPLLATVEEVE